MKRNVLNILPLAVAVVIGIGSGVGQTTTVRSLPNQSPSEGGIHPRGWIPGSQAGVLASQQMPVRRLPSRAQPQAGIRRLVPQNYSTIQAAIDASVDGDTVLVSEATYHENIRYRGKAIVVGSLYVTDGDTTHIAKTVIDGSSTAPADSGSIVYFVNGEDTTSVLCGLTIQGGTGTNWFFSSGSTSFWLREGGGIYCSSAGAKIVRNVVIRNRVVAPVVYGGGVGILGTHSHLTFVILEGNRITDNYVQGTSTAYWSYSGGADISGADARVVNNVFERDTVSGGQGVAGGGMSLTEYDNGAPLPGGIIAGNVFRSNVVSTSVQGAIGAGLLIGWTADVTVKENLFEANIATGPGLWALGGGVCVNDESVAGYGRKFIVNSRFLNNRIANNHINYGGGLLLYNTLATVSGNEFAGNAVNGSGAGEGGSPGGGGAISAYRSSFRIENNIVTGNSSVVDGAGLLVFSPPQLGSEQVLINNTITGNHAAGSGGGLRTYFAYFCVSLNNIFWNDTANTSGHEIVVTGSIGGIAYCDVKGGYSGTGNINADPAFLAGDSLFHLMPSSPCIESGIDSMQIGGVWYHAPTSDHGGMLRPMPAGTPPDIGAQEEQISRPAYAHNIQLARLSKDTLRIAARVENPLAHSLKVVGTLSNGGGVLIDSLSLKDDGLHGDGAAGDGLWGYQYVPKKDDTIHVAIRTDDLTAGTSRTLPDAAELVFTRGAIIAVDVRTVDFYEINRTISRLDTAFAVRNIGYSADSLTVSLDPVNIVPDTAASVHPVLFALAPGDSQKVTFSIRPNLLVPQSYSAQVIVESKSAFGQRKFWKNYYFSVITSVSDLAGVPKEFGLEQNYPNPFNPSTTIRYGLPNRSHVLLAVFNALGQQVALPQNGEQEAGYHEVRFDGKNLSSGVYFYRIQAGSFVETRKLLLLR